MALRGVRSNYQRQFVFQTLEVLGPLKELRNKNSSFGMQRKNAIEIGE